MIQNDQMRGLTQKRLHSRPYRWVRFPVATEDSAEIETLYLEGTTAAGAPLGHRFKTPTGKLEFYTPEQEAKFAALGLSALPEFYGEREGLIDLPYVELLDDDGADGVPNPFYNGAVLASRGRIVSGMNAPPAAALRDRGFTMELVSGRPPAPHFHSWTHNSWQAQEMWPDLYCQIHPEAAARLGIGDGERVKVETAHGQTEARAWIYAGIRKTAVFVPIGWGEKQPYHPWKPVNYLTDKTQRCPISEQTNLKSLLCRVTRVG
jgi:anaerobic selenocysteine-containing dehydrogenase